MNLETVDELCESLADMLGVYGCCKALSVDGVYVCENKDLCCCRTGFMMVMPDRIRESVANEKLLALSKASPPKPTE